MKTGVTLATEHDKKDILDLYKSLLGTEQCFWDEYYPNEDIIDFDISRKALFILRDWTKNNLLIAAISLDLDAEVEKLECWSNDLQPSIELSRLAVRQEYQNNGIGYVMMFEAINAARERGYKSAHYLVHKDNIKAQRSYKRHGFNHVGDCELFEMPFMCFERKISF